MQTSEKQGANLKNFTKGGGGGGGGANLKKILILRPKLGVKNCIILKLEQVPRGAPMPLAGAIS